MIIKDTSTLGHAIREARKRQGWTQVQLAGLAAVSTPFLSDLEAGKARKEIGKTLLVIRALGLDLHLNARSDPPTEQRRAGPPFSWA